MFTTPQHGRSKLSAVGATVPHTVHQTQKPATTSTTSSSKPLVLSSSQEVSTAMQEEADSNAFALLQAALRQTASPTPSRASSQTGARTPHSNLLPVNPLTNRPLAQQPSESDSFLHTPFAQAAMQRAESQTRAQQRHPAHVASVTPAPARENVLRPSSRRPSVAGIPSQENGLSRSNSRVTTPSSRPLDTSHLPALPSLPTATVAHGEHAQTASTHAPYQAYNDTVNDTYNSTYDRNHGGHPMNDTMNASFNPENTARDVPRHTQPGAYATRGDGTSPHDLGQYVPSSVAPAEAYAGSRRGSLSGVSASGAHVSMGAAATGAGAGLHDVSATELHDLSIALGQHLPDTARDSGFSRMPHDFGFSEDIPSVLALSRRCDTLSQRVDTHDDLLAMQQAISESLSRSHGAFAAQQEERGELTAKALATLSQKVGVLAATMLEYERDHGEVVRRVLGHDAATSGTATAADTGMGSATSATGIEVSKIGTSTASPIAPPPPDLDWPSQLRIVRLELQAFVERYLSQYVQEQSDVLLTTFCLPQYQHIDAEQRRLEALVREVHERMHTAIQMQQAQTQVQPQLQPARRVAVDAEEEARERRAEVAREVKRQMQAALREVEEAREKRPRDPESDAKSERSDISEDRLMFLEKRIRTQDEQLMAQQESLTRVERALAQTQQLVERQAALLEGIQSNVAKQARAVDTVEESVARQGRTVVTLEEGLARQAKAVEVGREERRKSEREVMSLGDKVDTCLRRVEGLEREREGEWARERERERERGRERQLTESALHSTLHGSLDTALTDAVATRVEQRLSKVDRHVKELSEKVMLQERDYDTIRNSQQDLFSQVDSLKREGRRQQEEVQTTVRSLESQVRVSADSARVNERAVEQTDRKIQEIEERLGNLQGKSQNLSQRYESFSEDVKVQLRQLRDGVDTLVQQTSSATELARSASQKAMQHGNTLVELRTDAGKMRHVLEDDHATLTTLGVKFGRLSEACIDLERSHNQLVDRVGLLGGDATATAEQLHGLLGELRSSTLAQCGALNEHVEEGLRGVRGELQRLHALHSEQARLVEYGRERAELSAEEVAVVREAVAAMQRDWALQRAEDERIAADVQAGVREVREVREEVLRERGALSQWTSAAEQLRADQAELHAALQAERERVAAALEVHAAQLSGLGARVQEQYEQLMDKYERLPALEYRPPGEAGAVRESAGPSIRSSTGVGVAGEGTGQLPRRNLTVGVGNEEDVPESAIHDASMSRSKGLRAYVRSPPASSVVDDYATDIEEDAFDVDSLPNSPRYSPDLGKSPSSGLGKSSLPAEKRAHGSFAREGALRKRSRPVGFRNPESNAYSPFPSPTHLRSRSVPRLDSESIDRENTLSGKDRRNPESGALVEAQNTTNAALMLSVGSLQQQLSSQALAYQQLVEHTSKLQDVAANLEGRFQDTAAELRSSMAEAADKAATAAAAVQGMHDVVEETRLVSRTLCSRVDAVEAITGAMARLEQHIAEIRENSQVEISRLRAEATDALDTLRRNGSIAGERVSAIEAEVDRVVGVCGNWSAVIQEYASRLEGVKATVDGVKSAAAAQQADIAAVKASVEGITNNGHTLAAKLDEALPQLASLLAAQSSTRSQPSHVDDTNAAMRLSQVEGRVASLEAARTSVDATVHALARDVTQAAEVAAAAAAKSDARYDELSPLATLLAGSNINAGTSTSALDVLTKLCRDEAWRAALERAVASVDATASVQDQVGDLRKSVEDLAKQYLENSSQLQRVESGCASLEDVVHNIGEAVSKAMNEIASAAEIAGSVRRVQEEQVLPQLRVVAEHTQALEAVQEDLQFAVQSGSAAQDAATAAVDAVEHLQSLCNALTERMDAAQGRAGDAAAEVAEREAKTAALSELEDAVVQAHRDLDSILVRVEALEDTRTISTREKALDSGAETPSLRSAVDAVRREVHGLRETVQGVVRTVDDVSITQSTCVKDVDVLNKTVDAVMADVRLLRSSVVSVTDVANEAISAAQAAVDTAEASGARVDAACEEIEEVSARCQGLVDAVATRFQEMDTKVDEVKVDIRDVTDTVAEMTTNVESLSANVNDMVSAAAKTDAVAQEALHQCGMVANDIGVLTARYTRSESTLQDLSVFSGNLEKEIQDIHSSISSFQENDAQFRKTQIPALWSRVDSIEAASVEFGDAIVQTARELAAVQLLQEQMSALTAKVEQHDQIVHVHMPARHSVDRDRTDSEYKSTLNTVVEEVVDRVLVVEHYISAHEAKHAEDERHHGRVDARLHAQEEKLEDVHRRVTEVSVAVATQAASLEDSQQALLELADSVAPLLQSDATNGKSSHANAEVASPRNMKEKHHSVDDDADDGVSLLSIVNSLSEVREQVETLSSALSLHSDTLSSHDSLLSTLADDVASHEGGIEAQANHLSLLADGVAAQERLLSAHADILSTHDDKLSSLEDMLSSHEEQLATHEQRVNSFTAPVDTIPLHTDTDTNTTTLRHINAGMSRATVVPASAPVTAAGDVDTTLHVSASLAECTATLAKHAAVLATQESTLAQYAATLERHEGAIGVQERTVATYSQSLAAVETSLRQHDILLTQQKQALTAHTADLQQHATALAAVGKHTSLLEEHTTTLRGVAATLAEHGAALVEVGEAVAECSDSVAAQEDGARAQRDAVAALERHVVQLRGDITTLRGDVAALSRASSLNMAEQTGASPASLPDVATDSFATAAATPTTGIDTGIIAATVAQLQERVTSLATDLEAVHTEVARARADTATLGDVHALQTTLRAVADDVADVRARVQTQRTPARERDSGVISQGMGEVAADVGVGDDMALSARIDMLYSGVANVNKRFDIVHDDVARIRTYLSDEFVTAVKELQEKIHAGVFKTSDFGTGLSGEDIISLAEGVSDTRTHALLPSLLPPLLSSLLPSALRSLLAEDDATAAEVAKSLVPALLPLLQRLLNSSQGAGFSDKGNDATHVAADSASRDESGNSSVAKGSVMAEVLQLARAHVDGALLDRVPIVAQEYLAEHLPALTGAYMAEHVPAMAEAYVAERLPTMAEGFVSQRVAAAMATMQDAINDVIAGMETSIAQSIDSAVADAVAGTVAQPTAPSHAANAVADAAAEVRPIAARVDAVVADVRQLQTQLGASDAHMLALHARLTDVTASLADTASRADCTAAITALEGLRAEVAAVHKAMAAQAEEAGRVAETARMAEATAREVAASAQQVVSTALTDAVADAARDIETRVSAKLSSASADMQTQLQTQLLAQVQAELQSGVSSLASDVEGQLNGVIAEVEGRFNELDGRVEAVVARVGDADGKLDALVVQVETVSARVNAFAEDARERGDSHLGTSHSTSGQTTTDVSRVLVELSGSLELLSASIAELDLKTHTTQAQTAALESQVESLSAAVEDAGVAMRDACVCSQLDVVGKIAEVESSLAHITGDLSLLSRQLQDIKEGGAEALGLSLVAADGQSQLYLANNDSLDRDSNAAAAGNDTNIELDVVDDRNPFLSDASTGDALSYLVSSASPASPALPAAAGAAGRKVGPRDVLASVQRVSEVSAQVDQLTHMLQGLQQQYDTAYGRANAAYQQTSAVEQRVVAAESQLDALYTVVEQLSDGVGAYAHKLTAVEDTLQQHLHTHGSAAVAADHHAREPLGLLGTDISAILGTGASPSAGHTVGHTQLSPIRSPRARNASGGRHSSVGEVRGLEELHAEDLPGATVSNNPDSAEGVDNSGEGIIDLGLTLDSAEETPPDTRTEDMRSTERADGAETAPGLLASVSVIMDRVQALQAQCDEVKAQYEGVVMTCQRSSTECTVIADQVQSMKLVVAEVSQRVDNTHARMDATNQRIDAVEGTVGTTQRRVDAVEEAVDATQHRIDTVERGAEDLRHALSTVQRRADATDALVDAVAKREDAAYERVDAMKRSTDAVEVRMNAVDAVVVGVDRRIAVLADRVATVGADLTAVDRRMTAVQGEVTTVDSKVSMLNVSVAAATQQAALAIEQAGAALQEVHTLRVTTPATVATTPVYTAPASAALVASTTDLPQSTGASPDTPTARSAPSVYTGPSANAASFSTTTPPVPPIIAPAIPAASAPLATLAAGYPRPLAATTPIRAAAPAAQEGAHTAPGNSLDGHGGGATTPVGVAGSARAPISSLAATLPSMVPADTTATIVSTVTATDLTYGDNDTSANDSSASASFSSLRTPEASRRARARTFTPSSSPPTARDNSTDAPFVSAVAHVPTSTSASAQALADITRAYAAPVSVPGAPAASISVATPATAPPAASAASITGTAAGSASSQPLTSTRAAIQALLRRPVLPRIEPLPAIGAAVTFSNVQYPSPAVRAADTHPRNTSTALPGSGGVRTNTGLGLPPLAPVDPSAFLLQESFTLTRMRPLDASQVRVQVHSEASVPEVEEDEEDHILQG